VWAAQQKLEETSYEGPNQILRTRESEMTDRPRIRNSEPAPPELRRITQDVLELGKSRSIDEALMLFRTVAQADALLYSTILNVCCKALRSKEAWDIWAQIPQDMKNLVMYNTMLDLCKRVKQVRDAEGLVREMEELGVTKNIITYNTMISVYSMAGDPDRAVEVFEELRTDSLPLASIGNQQRAFLAVMSATARAGDYAKTREFFVGMLEASLQPNNLHLNSLLTSCVAQAHAEIAKQVFASIPAYGFTQRIEDYTALLACCRHSLSDCQRIYDEAIRAGLQPTTQTQEKMLEAYVLAGDGFGARQVLSETPTLNRQSRKVKWLLDEMEKLPVLTIQSP